MRHISQLITPSSPESVVQMARRNPSAQDESSKASSAERKKDKLEQLWEHMTELYGHRWTSTFGLTPINSWRRGLQHVTGPQIAKGLGRLLERGDEWPPSLPEFVALCTRDPSAPLAPYHKPAPKALPAPTNRALGLSVLEELKQRWPKRQRGAA